MYSDYCEQPTKEEGSIRWILKNSKELLEHLKSQTFNYVTSIKSCDFPRFILRYPTRNWKTGSLVLSETPSFSKQLTVDLYKYLVLDTKRYFFVKEHSDSKNKCSENEIIKKGLSFSWQHFHGLFPVKVFQQTVGIPMDTNRTPPLADIFLYSCEAEFIQYLLSTREKQ